MKLFLEDFSATLSLSLLLIHLLSCDAVIYDGRESSPPALHQIASLVVVVVFDFSCDPPDNKTSTEMTVKRVIMHGFPHDSHDQRHVAPMLPSIDL